MNKFRANLNGSAFEKGNRPFPASPRRVIAVTFSARAPVRRCAFKPGKEGTQDHVESEDGASATVAARGVVRRTRFAAHRSMQRVELERGLPSGSTGSSLLNVADRGRTQSDKRTDLR